MRGSEIWFLCQALLGVAMLLLGWRLGRARVAMARAGLGAGLAWLCGWAWLLRRPDVALEVIPLDVLSHTEGTGALPGFMLIIGVLWSRCTAVRQRRTVAAAVLLGIVYFFNGGFWMIQSSPRETLGKSRGPGPVMQTQDFSCVPAACATALTMMGIPTDEAEMADLTQTRAGTGATVVRALQGLEHKVVGSGYRVSLVRPAPNHLDILPTPALTPITAAATQKHMVVLLRANEHSVRIIDPQYGEMEMDREEFDAVYTSQVIIFENL